MAYEFAAKPGDELAANIGQTVRVSGKVAYLCEVYDYTVYLERDTGRYELLP